MEITLKQADVKAAVRLYIERQGIHLHNKSLDVVFAMGRGENGLSATLTIEDIALPVFKDTDTAAAKQSGPSDAVKAMIYPAGARTAELSGDGQITGLAVANTGATEVLNATGTAAVVDGAVEEVKTEPATLAQLEDAGIVAKAAVLTEAPAVETAEAKVETEAAPAATAEAAPAKATTSLFGN